MKRLSIIIFSILLSHLISMGNSAPPIAALSELMVDSLGNWTVELHLNSPNAIDSIEVGFSSGNSKVANYTLISPDDFVLIDNSNLVTPISVNYEGDYIIIRSWASSYWHYDSLAFGNYPGSYLDCDDFGDSYTSIRLYNGACLRFGFTIDKTPTLGLENDTSGAVAYISGDIYDPNGAPIYEGTLIFGTENLYYDIYGGGTFSGPIFAHRYYSDTITIKSESYPYTLTTYTIQPIEFCSTPGSTIQEDIICTSLVDVDEIIEEETTVVISPNPFLSTVTFYWEIPNFLINDKVELCIFDQQGKLVFKEMIHSEAQSYKWTPNDKIQPGMFIYHLLKNGENLSSGKIIKI